MSLYIYKDKCLIPSLAWQDTLGLTCLFLSQTLKQPFLQETVAPFW